MKTLEFIYYLRIRNKWKAQQEAIEIPVKRKALLCRPLEGPLVEGLVSTNNEYGVVSMV